MPEIHRHRNADGKYILQVEPPTDTITPWAVPSTLFGNTTESPTPTACSTCLRDIPSLEPFAIEFCDGDDYDLDDDTPWHYFVNCGDCTEDFLDMTTDAQTEAYRRSRAATAREYLERNLPR